MLDKHYQDGSIFSGHVSHKGVPGVELSTGSLGHGLSVASGMALAAKIEQKKHRVFVVMSDGELDEGSNWEALMFASHNSLNNLVALIDRNRLQSIKSTEETLALINGVRTTGIGKWAEIKRLAHPGIADVLENRSPVDLKDKWRNLTRIAKLPKASLKARLQRGQSDISLETMLLVKELMESHPSDHH